jgi:RNA recognition motif-containing protein
MTTEAASAPETTPKISEVRALLEDSSLHKIYVGNVPYSATVDDLKSHLAAAGQVYVFSYWETYFLETGQR